MVRLSVANFFCLVTLLGGLCPFNVFGDDWPQWRGPTSDNHSADGNRVPLKWNLETGENVLWRQPVPGRGHSTPTIVGDSIYITTADKTTQTQTVLAYDRETGRNTASQVLHKHGLPERIHGNNSHASPSIAFDGTHLFVVFHTLDAIWLTALTPDLGKVWQRRVAEFAPKRFQFGYGASPIIEDDLVIIAAEYDGPDAGIYAMDRTTGEPVWRADRKSNLSFGSPIVATIAGERLLLIGGGQSVSAYDPSNGRIKWSVPAAAAAVCGTCVWDGRHVLLSGGYPEKGTVCINAAGDKKLLWENRVMCYEQSLLANNGYVYAVADNGVAYCWRIIDGKEMWRQRLFGGGISASPVLVDNKIIITTEAAEVFTIAAIPDRFDLLSKNKVGDSAFATPVVVDNRMYVRAAEGTGEQRREFIVAIAGR